MKIGRNEQCWCGSGKKYKKCHLNRKLDKPVQPWEASAKTRKAFISADMALVWVNVDSQYLAQELAEQIASVVHKRTHAQKVVGQLL